MKNTQIHVILILLTLVVTSCGKAATSVTDPGLTSDPYPLKGEYAYLDRQTSNEISWGCWEGTISADRTEVTLVPTRGVDAINGTYNVLWWLEQAPCTDCLQIVSKEMVGPNRMDLTLQLRHPFPEHPKWTGFDVLGGLWFESTRMLSYDTYMYPFVISWRFDGEAQLLNPDGYHTHYCAMQYDERWKGFIPGNFGSEVVDDPWHSPQLLWGFRMFRTSEGRNVFETTGSDTQTFELWLPEGKEIRFGYNVLASWSLPETEPVTNPVEDFPLTTNRAIYRFEVVDISGPASPTEDAVVRFRIYYQPGVYDLQTDAYIKFYGDDQEDLVGAGGVRWKSIEMVGEDKVNGVNEYLLTLERWPEGPDKGPPGMYPYFVNVNMQPDGLDYSSRRGRYILEIAAAD